MLDKETIEQNKERFLNLFINDDNGSCMHSHPGHENCLDWLKKSDFFEAPSSTLYHGNYEGGLCEHSLNVYRIALKLKDVLMSEGKTIDFTDDDLKVSALLHDICKTNFYVTKSKVFKDEEAPIGQQWKKYMTYEIDDKLPYGHGEKSVFILQRFFQLTGNEALAIRWHMGNSDPSISMSSYTKSAYLTALETVPLVMIISLADQFSTFLIEKKSDPKENWFY